MADICVVCLDQVLEVDKEGHDHEGNVVPVELRPDEQPCRCTANKGHKRCIDDVLDNVQDRDLFCQNCNQVIKKQRFTFPPLPTEEEPQEQPDFDMDEVIQKEFEKIETVRSGFDEDIVNSNKIMADLPPAQAFIRKSLDHMVKQAETYRASMLAHLDGFVQTEMKNADQMLLSRAFDQQHYQTAISVRNHPRRAVRMNALARFNTIMESAPLRQPSPFDLHLDFQVPHFPTFQFQFKDLFSQQLAVESIGKSIFVHTYEKPGDVATILANGKMVVIRDSIVLDNAFTTFKPLDKEISNEFIVQEAISSELFDLILVVKKRDNLLTSAFVTLNFKLCRLMEDTVGLWITPKGAAFWSTNESMARGAYRYHKEFMEIKQITLGDDQRYFWTFNECRFTSSEDSKSYADICPMSGSTFHQIDKEMLYLVRESRVCEQLPLPGHHRAMVSPSGHYILVVNPDDKAQWVTIRKFSDPSSVLVTIPGPEDMIDSPIKSLHMSGDGSRVVIATEHQLFAL